jgi:hypothetical protein
MRLVIRELISRMGGEGWWGLGFGWLRLWLMGWLGGWGGRLWLKPTM